MAYGQAYRLAGIADEIRELLRAIDTGVYGGMPVVTPRGTFASGAPVRTPEDREKVHGAIRDRLRLIRASLTAIEAAVGIRWGKGGVER